MPNRCRECNSSNVFYDAKIAACEGFMHMQVCESCFERSLMLGRGEGTRYELDTTGKFVTVP